MQRFQNILVVCDETPGTEGALSKALWLARANQSRVTLIEVMEIAPEALAARLASVAPRRAAEIADQVVTGFRTRLDRNAARFREADIPVSTLLAEGVEFVEVIRRVLDAGHDLVLKGAHDAARSAVFAGPDMHLMRKCPCPVWIIHPGQPDNARQILAAVDPDADDETRKALNRLVMELGTSLAEREDASLHVLGAWRLQEESALRTGRVRLPEDELRRIIAAERNRVRSALDELVEPFEAFSERMTVTLTDGFAGDVIPAYAAEHAIDTIVMGTVGRTGLRGYLIGNTAETILASVRCTVLTVKPPEFVSPVRGDG